MNWKKLGRIFVPNKEILTHYSYASVPFIGSITEDGLIEIFYSSRDPNNKSHLFKMRYDIKDKIVVECSSKPILSPGRFGDFDYDGVMGCGIFEINSEKFLTYIGWNLGKVVPFRNAIGLARINNDKVERIFDGPILDRSKYDPCFVASNCVIKLNTKYLMYYLSCFKWTFINNIPIHYYNIKIAESCNGFDWIPTGKIAIDFRFSNEYAISVPRVIFENDIYRMWYSYRGNKDIKTYRIGYAESDDALNWKRKDEEIILDVSEDGWDSEMICYPYVFDYNNQRYMLYNGNGYGKTGIGLAIWN